MLQKKTEVQYIECVKKLRDVIEAKDEIIELLKYRITIMEKENKKPICFSKN